ncbi:MAG: hypothetical protein DKM50_11695 [Candidatus Margulisiibacteriota bacterium]|nr:MAG: hypothetical protein A2X43_02940 [Candidatus Margulisbacteria bacterium GWD2_39_127]OGI01210.1 MAG: hypothetical protein A2X42_06245 [Candidatus Margulisbacteria bacterium GWF2_38_17]OGI09845.1 MAG: hypothetical protein A2X41_09965 [Candidatus Margulisbacteria bacterium GWE2_39_32]PZM78435.1 MAG: hypothetical protein DKM50_11695 [Candidatus Margulisiibacteriota bacterium]HAR64153.1 hypothetical protein [Candidatus Margulisiibacteriota bacterium]
MARTEEEIREDVLNHLYWDSRVNESNIDVVVKNDTVNLLGSVPDYIAREAAQRDAHNVRDVGTVNNQLIIRHNPESTSSHDQDTETRVRDVFLWNSAIDANRIEVSVNNGVVTLKGSTASYWQKIVAEEMAFEVRGASKVINELAVVPTRSFTDNEIAQDITAALSRDKIITIDAIDINVKDGKVTLAGTVGSSAEIYAVWNIAKNTEGVVDIVNYLTHS